MNCQEIVALKHAYADRELDLVRTTEIERHLSGCRACSQAYENIRALSAALKSSSLYFEAPAHLKKRIRASLGAENKNAPTPQRPNAPTLSRFHTVLVAMAQMGNSHRGNRPDCLAACNLVH